MNSKPLKHLKAPTPERLRLLMLANNNKYSKEFHYFDVQWVIADKMWYCWFELSLSDEFPKGVKLR